MKRDNGGNKSTEYMLTVDTAKQVKVASEYVELVGMKQGRPDKTSESRPFLSRRNSLTLGESLILNGKFHSVLRS